MKQRFTAQLGLAVCLALLLSPQVVCEEVRKATTSSKTAADDPVSALPVKVARDRAKLLSKVYASTLNVMHDRYFHGARATVPARALESVFAELKRDEQIDARWISVSLRPMSINHKPKSEFEQHAAREIKSGKRDVEQVSEGFYRRATAIPLQGGCVHCHDRSFTPSTSPKFAGLVISIPIADKSASGSAENESK